MSDEMAWSVLKRKCGIQLHLQRLQPRFRQALLQLGVAQFAVVKFFVVIERVVHRDDHEINQDVEMPRLDEQRLERLSEWDWLACLPQCDHCSQRDVGGREERAGKSVNGESASPTRAFDGKSPCQPQRWYREQREHIPIRQ
jgi:hypothetical protein